VNRIHARLDVQPEGGKVADRVESSRLAPVALLAAATGLMFVLVAPAALFAAGMATFAVLRGGDAAAAPTSAIDRRMGSRPVAPPTRAGGEARSASALASPVVAILRRWKELDGDPKVASEGSELVGALRESARSADAAAWPDLRARVESWMDSVRESPQGPDQQIVDQLTRMRAALAGD
jgi:hypothetical protein